MSALLPAVLLLLWSGLAATLFASLLIAPLAGLPAGALAPTLRPVLPLALAAGTLLYPAFYGLAFALLGEASILTGTLLGAGHALVPAVRSFRLGGRGRLADQRGRILLHVVYGAMLGFIYVTP